MTAVHITTGTVRLSELRVNRIGGFNHCSCTALRTFDPHSRLLAFIITGFYSRSIIANYASIDVDCVKFMRKFAGISVSLLTASVISFCTGVTSSRW